MRMDYWKCVFSEKSMHETSICKIILRKKTRGTKNTTAQIPNLLVVCTLRRPMGEKVELH